MYFDVLALDGGAAGRSEAPARPQQTCQLLGVAGEVKHRVDTVGRDRAHLTLELTGVVDRMDLRPGQPGNELCLGAGTSRSDHLRAARGSDLNRQRTHASGG